MTVTVKIKKPMAPSISDHCRVGVAKCILSQLYKLH